MTFSTVHIAAWRGNTRPHVTTLARSIALVAFCVLAPMATARSQVTLDVLQDLRHSTDPSHNPRNFPALEIKLFKQVGFGSFLMKEAIDLDGTNRNPSKIYTQLSQSIKLGTPSVLLHLGYSGGLGVFNDATGGFYLQNSYDVGLEHPLSWGPVFGSAYLAYRYTNANRASSDPMLAVYVGRGFRNYRIYASLDLEMWSKNRNLGDAWNETLRGKELSVLNESELWVKVHQNLSVGTFTRVSSNVYVASHRWYVYPSLGVKYEF